MVHHLDGTFRWFIVGNSLVSREHQVGTGESATHSRVSNASSILCSLCPWTSGWSDLYTRSSNVSDRQSNNATLKHLMHVINCLSSNIIVWHPKQFTFMHCTHQASYIYRWWSAGRAQSWGAASSGGTWVSKRQKPRQAPMHSYALLKA